MNIARDPRIPQAKKLILNIIAKKDYDFSDVMITRDNTLVIIVRETAIYTTKLLDIQPGFTICFNFSQSTYEGLEEDQYIPNKIIEPIMTDIYNRYLSVELNPLNLLASEPELRGNDEFERLLALKSADGAEFYKILGTNFKDVYYVPIFTGFPSINKPDKIGINVYDLHDGHFLNIMNIFKKKINREMKIYFRTINLGRSI